MALMDMKKAWQTMGQHPVYRLAMFIIGCLFMIAAPIVSPLPGPGGIVLFALGLGMVLRNSLWAKRRYVRFKRVRPKMGSWADWGLRRPSARRRTERAKQTRQLGD
jgi:hypothetical protein